MWHSPRFQKKIYLDFVMKEHQMLENIHDKVQLEKDGMYGKRKKFTAYPQRLKYEEKRRNKLNREE
jgi:hypothetical protein